MALACPTETELAALLRGDLPQSQQARLEQHLEDCMVCRQRFDAFVAWDANWLRGARSFAKASPPADNPVPVPRLKSDLPSTLQIKLPPLDALLAPGVSPQRLGDYEILGELGRGGMGVVFKARQHSLQRDVALKVILAGQLASGAHIRRFQIEAEAAARLDHANIVPIYDIGQHEGRHFFSMKLIEGASLRARRQDFQALKSGVGGSGGEVLERQRKLARLLADIARAVHHAHQRGVLHRDLKPGNVLIDAQDQPHLTDFGLAKLLQSDSDLTLSRMVMGTPEYMSPEQAAGHARKITTGSDVYSLGAILYELLTGQPPFVDGDPMRVMNRVQSEEPRPPRALNPSLALDLEIICLRCLEKEPARRLRSAEALAEELERFQAGEPIRSRAVSVLEKIWRWAGRKPALAGALASLILVFILGFAGVVWKWQGEVAQRQLAQSATRRADAESARAQRAATRLEIEGAEAQFHDANSDVGLARLARLVRETPTNRVVLERLLNALSYRRFALPIAPLTHDATTDATSGTKPRPMGQVASTLNVTVGEFSPDGGLLMTAGMDGTARIWNPETGHPAGEALRHGAPLLWAQFNPDGSALVTAAENGTARIWRIATRQFVELSQHHRAAVWHASFSADGRRLVTASADHTARVWDATTGQPIGEAFPHAGPVYFAAFAPDGNRILTAEFGAEGPPAHLWDLKTRESIRLPHHGRPEVRYPFPCFSPSGDQVLVFREGDGFLFSARNAATGRPIQLHHDDDVLALAFSPDGRLAVTGSRDATARIWSAAGEEGKFPVLNHKQAVNSLAFDTTGQLLLTGSSDHTARLWKIGSGRPLTEPVRHQSPVLGTLISSNRIVTLSEAEGAWLWSLPGPESPALSWRSTRRVDLARFTPDSRFVLTLGSAGWSLLDARSGKAVRKELSPERRLRDLPDVPDDADQSPQRILDFDLSSRVFPRGPLLATAMESGNALLWAPFDASSDRPVRRPFGVAAAALLCVRFSPDGRCLLTTSDNGEAFLWELESRRQVFPALRHRGRINHAEFNREGKLIVTASWDRTAQVWDAQTGKPAAPPLQHDGEVNWAAFDPTGTRVATASRDKTVGLWSAQTGERILTLRHDSALAEKYPFDFSPDGKRLASVAGDSLQVWDTATGKSVLGPLRLNALLLSVRFSPDGARLVTSANNGMANVWDASYGHSLMEPMAHERRVTYAEFSPDGRCIVTSSWDDHVGIWPLVSPPLTVPKWLPELAEALAGQRIGTNNVSETVPVEKLFQLCQDLETRAGSDYFTRWVRWFLGRRQNASKAGLFDLEPTEP